MPIISANVNAALTVNDQLESPGAAVQQISYRKFNLVAALPEGTLTSDPEITLNLGVGVIDCTQLPGPDGSIKDATGKRLLAFLIRNTGANAIDVAPGTTDPYDLFGPAGKIQLGGDVNRNPVQVLLNQSGFAPLVSATAKNIEVQGTDGDVVQMQLLFEDG